MSDKQHRSNSTNCSICSQNSINVLLSHQGNHTSLRTPFLPQVYTQMGKGNAFNLFRSTTNVLSAGKHSPQYNLTIVHIVFYLLLLVKESEEVQLSVARDRDISFQSVPILCLRILEWKGRTYSSAKGSESLGLII